MSNSGQQLVLKVLPLFVLLKPIDFKGHKFKKKLGSEILFIDASFYFELDLFCWKKTFKIDSHFKVLDLSSSMFSFSLSSNISRTNASPLLDLSNFSTNLNHLFSSLLRKLYFSFSFFLLPFRHLLTFLVSKLFELA